MCLFYFGRRNPLRRGLELQNASVNTHSHAYPPPMFEQHFDSDILFHHDHKLFSQNLYLCQPHTVIQLIEVASPPPQPISSPASSSSSSSSSFEEVDDEDDSVHSSYCSSDDEIDVPRAAQLPDALSGRMKRILLWREQSPQLISGWSSYS